MQNNHSIRHALALLVLICTPALAHDYWFERSGGDYVLYQGHLYSAHGGEERVPYAPAVVQEAYCVRAGVLERVAPPSTYPLRIDGACAAVYVQSSSGYWSQTLTGTRNVPKTEVFGALRGWRSEESIKYVASWSSAFAHALTPHFELVPLSNPLAVAVGEKLRVRAVWRGTPRAGVTVAYQGEPRGVTGADGTVNIRLRAPGTQVLAASFEEPLDDPKADKVVRATILQFELPGGERQ